MSKHTPGPWEAGHTFKEHHAVAAPDGRLVALTGIIGAEDEPESITNARLIASAPELLAALEAMLAGWESGRTYATTINNAREAIAKAKGE